MLVQVIRQALRCFAYRVDVHAVWTRPQNATQASGSEFQVLEKCIVAGGFIGCQSGKLFLVARIGALGPAFEVSGDGIGKHALLLLLRFNSRFE